MIKPKIESTLSWDIFFLKQVYLLSSKSKDTSTKVGAILVRDRRVIAQGYNGMCEFVNDYDPTRYQRPKKYSFFEHAERNAIYQCAKFGVSSENSTMYINGLPCADCARAIIQSGVSEVVLHQQWQNIFKNVMIEKRMWMQDYSDEMFEESFVNIRYVNKVLGITTLISEKEYQV